MANFEKMIPFLLKSEAGLKNEYIGLPYEEMFEVAKQTGYSNSPYDKGGPTMCGVTIATYTDYRKKRGVAKTTVADLKNITFYEWKTILKTMYWDRWKADSIDDEMVAIALVDWVWGSGKYGITIPQRILGVAVDGKVGPKTLAAVNNYPNQQELFDKIQAARNAYHASIAKPGTKNAHNLAGWNNRVNRITYDGINYA